MKMNNQDYRLERMLREYVHEAMGRNEEKNEALLRQVVRETLFRAKLK